MKISSAIDIKSTPKVVFGWLENPEKAKMWMTSVSDGEILYETADRVGTTFREVVEDEVVSLKCTDSSQVLKRINRSHFIWKVESISLMWSITLSRLTREHG